jgi:hypothetical protein
LGKLQVQVESSINGDVLVSVQLKQSSEIKLGGGRNLLGVSQTSLLLGVDLGAHGGSKQRGNQKSNKKTEEK